MTLHNQDSDRVITKDFPITAIQSRKPKIISRPKFRNDIAENLLVTYMNLPENKELKRNLNLSK